MADEADIANDYMQAQIDYALRVQASQNRRTAEIGPKTCSKCGGTMPEARRKHGFVLCVGCQELEERNGC